MASGLRSLRQRRKCCVTLVALCAISGGPCYSVSMGVLAINHGVPTQWQRVVSIGLREVILPMVDAIFSERRLANIYDDLDSDRSDLDAYVAMVEEFSARSVLDIGCGTGTLACLLAGRGMEVTAVDPAAASLEVARRKPYADRVRWLAGDAMTLPPLQVDMVTMTGNAAQVFLTDDDLASTLRAARAAMKPAGVLVFEVRNPAREGWREWNREQSRRRLEIPRVGGIETWTELTDVHLPFVSFRMMFVFETDGAVLTSDSTLRFRSRDEIVDSLRRADLIEKEVRDAPDRPGREFVFIAEAARIPQDGSGGVDKDT